MKVSKLPGFAQFIRFAVTIFRREPWWAEFWSALVAMAWALLSYGSMEPLRTWPAMAILTGLAGDQFWHLLGFGLGLCQMVFLLFDRRWMRWGAAVALCWFWGVLTVGVWTAMPWTPTVATYAGWCGINCFSILRLLRDYHGLQERAHV